MLEIQNLHKSYAHREILRDVSLSCASAELCAVLGVNGSGKSTLLRLIAGIVCIDSGSISIQGHDLARQGRSAKAVLGYVPDASESVPELRVGEYVSLTRALKQAWPSPTGDERLGELRAALRLEAVWSQPLSQVSFGQRKRACLLAALIGDPWLLLLDEPSNGLDPAGIEFIVQLLREHAAAGGCALFTSNDVPFVSALATRAVELKEGQLRAAALDAL